MRLRFRSARLKKKTPLGGAASGRTGGHGDDAILLTPGAPGKGRGPGEAGSIRNLRLIGSAKVVAQTRKPKWVVWSVCCPLTRLRAELTRRGLERTRKRYGGSLVNWGRRCWLPAPVDLMRFRAGGLPAGNEFAGKSVAAEIDGGRVRVRTIVKKLRVSGKTKRKKFRVEWREPKVLILFEVDEKSGRGPGKPPRYRRHAPRPRCADRIGRVSFAPNGCCPGQGV